MQRRILMLGGVLASTSLSNVRAASAIQVIYVGGWD